MEIIVLSNEEQIRLGATHRATITHADLTETTVNTPQSITLLAAPARSAFELVGFDLVAAFKDASDAAFNTTTLILGDSDDDKFIASTQLNENGTEILAGTGTGTRAGYATATNIIAKFTGMSGKALNDIDTGRIDLYFKSIVLTA